MMMICHEGEGRLFQDIADGSECYRIFYTVDRFLLHVHADLR